MHPRSPLDQGTVGSLWERVLTVYRPPQGRCVFSMNERHKEQQQVGSVFGVGAVRGTKHSPGKMKQEVGLRKTNCRKMSRTHISTGPSMTELLFKLQPTCTSGMLCLLLPWKSKKVSECVLCEEGQRGSQSK